MCAQPEVQSKVDILGGLPATAAEAAVQAEHRLNLARSRETDRENGYENRLPVFSYERSPSVLCPKCGPLPMVTNFCFLPCLLLNTCIVLEVKKPPVQFLYQ